MNARAGSDESKDAISDISAPPMKEAALAGWVAPVRTTARRELSDERDVHASLSLVMRVLLTRLIFAGLEIVIIPIVLPGECWWLLVRMLGVMDLGSESW